MPDFRRLFFIAKVLTCCCCCSRRKPENARGPNHPYGTRHDQPTGSSSENTSDYSEYSVPPAYPGGPLNLIHPDEFEIPDELNEVHGRDDFGFDLKKSRSLVPCPPTPHPSSPATSEPATTRPSTAKPDTMMPGTAEPTTTKTISDEPVASPSVIAETTAAESVTERSLADEPGTPKPVVVEPITDNTSVDKSVTAEPEATGSTIKKPVADETGATKSVVTKPKLDAEPVEPGPTETKTDRPKFVSVDLAEAGPRKSDIEASEVKDGTTEASSGGVGPTENKDEDKGKDKVSE